jgi:hypothetical protein
MKLRNSFVTAGFAALALAGASVLGSAESAQAFGLTFDPSGSQLDGDKILDLLAMPNSPVTFTLNFDSNQMDSTGIITEIVLNFGWDNMELTRVGVDSDTYTATSSNTLSPVAPDAVPYSTPLASSNSGAVPPAFQKSLKFTDLGINGLGFKANTGNYALGTISFTTGAPLPNNGIRDFYTLLTAVRGTVSGSTANEFVQSSIDNGNIPQLYKQLEVQPVPTPALLPGLAAFGMSLVRKRKQEQAA